jgi:hypothetical protein
MQGAQGVTALFIHEPISLTRVEIPTSRLNSLPSATQVTSSSSCYSSSCFYICVLILQYVCPRTTMYLSSYYYICVGQGLVKLLVYEALSY